MKMLNKESENNRMQLGFYCIEDLVPRDHLLRKIERSIDFKFIYDLVKGTYCEDNGRPSIDPVVLFKMVFIQYIFGIGSMRKTVQEIEVNVAYRWFLGYGLTDKIPHFTTFGKNYSRRFADTDIFERIFSHILLEAVKCGYVDTNAVFIDATHIKASANRNKKMKEQVKVQAKLYHEELMKDINTDRENHNKKPFDDNDKAPPNEGIKTVTKSTTDPESGMFVKGDHERCFAYTAHTACDKNNFILGVNVSPGNIHDSVMFKSIYDKVKNIFPEINYVVADAGYKTPHICKQIIDNGRVPVLPYKRPMGKKDFFKPYEYIYDEYNNWIICPQGHELTYRTTNRDGYREFKSNARICSKCENLSKCTHSKEKTKTITQHVWFNYMEMAEHLRYVPALKEMYSKRSQTIERVFADAKENHSLRYTRLRGKAKNQFKVLLTFACMNLKKLAIWKSKDPRYQLIFMLIIENFQVYMRKPIDRCC